MQWLAEKKYGVNELERSLSSWPVHRYVLPFSCVKMIFATAFDALTSSVDCGVTHLTSISHPPERPMSDTSFAVRLLRCAGSTSWCDTAGTPSVMPSSAS